MKVLVIKCGGSIIDELDDSFFESIRDLQNNQFKILFVHGGGPDINAMLKQNDIESVFENGLRKTTDEVLEVVELMLAGKSNRRLVHKLQQNKINAIGLNGSDGKLLTGEFVNELVLGSVGEVVQVNTELLLQFLEADICPVLTPMAMSTCGRKLNVNADMAAGAVAEALHADMCLFVTDVSGVMKDNKLLAELTAEDTQALIKEGSIYGGMIPKVTTALSVLNTGSNEVMIVSGKECFFQDHHFIGTKFYKEEGRVLL